MTNFFRAYALIIFCCMLQPKLSAMNHDGTNSSRIERKREGRANNCALFGGASFLCGAGIFVGELIGVGMATKSLTGGVAAGLSIPTTFMCAGLTAIFIGCAIGIGCCKLCCYADENNGKEENESYV